jgi:serine/threonine-protein kinase
MLRLLQPLVGSRSPFFEEIRSWTMSTATRTQADALEAWDALLSGSLAAGKQVFERYPLSALTDEHSPLHFAYGVWLHLTEGKEIAAAHFSGVLDAPHPWTTALPSHFLLSDKEPARLNHLFPWEEKELRRYLSYCDHLQMHRM